MGYKDSLIKKKIIETDNNEEIVTDIKISYKSKRLEYRQIRLYKPEILKIINCEAIKIGNHLTIKPENWFGMINSNRIKKAVTRDKETLRASITRNI